MSDEKEWAIRPATHDDLNSIMLVEQRVHAFPWDLEAFKGEFKKNYSHFLVITDDETDSIVAGYIVFWLLFDECQILNLAVDTSHRGMGHAKRLVRQAVKMAVKADLRKVTLEVRKSNQPAIELYQGLGFTIRHVRKAFYSNGEDAYVMGIEIDSALVADF
jgi:[ribosomal protein S18]-alanine N-acetyltransferase